MSMTPAEHVRRVRQVAFQLWRADYGMGMPRDYQLVCRLSAHFEQVTTDAMAAIHDAFVNGPMSIAEAVQALDDMGVDEAVRVVSEWAECAEADAQAERALYAPDPEQV